MKWRRDLYLQSVRIYSIATSQIKYLQAIYGSVYVITHVCTVFPYTFVLLNGLGQ